MTEARPSCSQIKVAMETGSRSKGKSPGIQTNKPHHEGGVPDATRGQRKAGHGEPAGLPSAHRLRAPEAGTAAGAS